MAGSDLLEVSDDKKGHVYAVMPPLESFSRIKEYHLKEEFLASIRAGDIICGQVRTSRYNGFPVDVLCCSHGPVRDLTRCRVKGMLQFKSMPPLTAKSLEKGDYIRAVVTGVDERLGELSLSLLAHNLPRNLSNVALGLIDENDLPLYFRKIVRSPPLESDYSFTELLEQSDGFSNPSCVSTLVNLLGINDSGGQSELPSLRSLKIPPDDFGLNLRQKQSRHHALQCVEAGIRFAKRGEIAAAVRQFNRALDLDQSNVEALVARGAMYANQEDFKKAIENFEKALGIEAGHAEARSYLYESLVGLALAYSRDRCYESARRCLRKAGDVAPEKRLELEKMASRLVSPSLLKAMASSPSRDDASGGAALSEKKVSPMSSGDRSAKKSREYYSISSDESRSPLELGRKKKKKSKKAKKHHRHHKRKRSRSSSSSSSVELTAVTHMSPQAGHVPRQLSWTSAKRPRLEPDRAVGRLRHSMSSIDVFVPKPQLERGDSLEDMEKFLEELKQKRTSVSSSK